MHPYTSLSLGDAANSPAVQGHPHPCRASHLHRALDTRTETTPLPFMPPNPWPHVLVPPPAMTIILVKSSTQSGGAGPHQ